MVKEILKNILSFFNHSLFTIGETNVTLGTILYAVFAFIALFVITNKIQRLLENKILSRATITRGIAKSVGIITRYVIIFTGILFILQSLGINISSLGILAGAFGVGIGFGLQNITNNFISGIIILFENPIKIGDRIEVGEIKGDVVNISARSTTIITNDNISIIVPNSDFINGRVINWSHNDRNVRFRFPVGVSYKEDPENVRDVVLKVVNNHSGVLKSPPPALIFTEYGDSSINFELFVWTSRYIDRPVILKSELYYEIFKAFRLHNIEIPFPQRDIHIKDDKDKKFEKEIAS